MKTEWTVKYTEEAISDLSRLDKSERLRIVDKIDWMKRNFDLLCYERLTGELGQFYKLRVGPYRVIYGIDPKGKVIVIYRVGHRREIYKL